MLRRDEKEITENKSTLNDVFTNVRYDFIRSLLNTLLTVTVDNNMAEFCYANIEDLDEKILTMIDSDDIHYWTPIGTKEFVEKFTKLYGGSAAQTIETEVSFGYDIETQGLINF